MSVDVTIYKYDNDRIESFATAFDGVSSANLSTRYGFLSDFYTIDGDNHKDIDELRKYHINMVQYYDWSYRHDSLVGTDNLYTDMMGRRVDLETVKKKIAFCKTYNMKSLGYGAVYAATKDFYDKRPDWGLYTSADKPLTFIDIFYIMNISRECPWHNHIIDQYKKAVRDVGFDGVHMDTYGFPKTAISKYNGQTKLLKLEEHYAGLIEDAKTALDEIKKENYLIFNNVGNWPVKTVANSPQDAIYIEVWEPYERYFHIKQIIVDAKREAKDKKPVILAAYLSPFREENTKRAGTAAQLLIAAIVSNGAYRLIMIL